GGGVVLGLPAGRREPGCPSGPLIVHQGWQSGIQIALSPLGARALLRVPAAEIAHIVVDANLLLGPAALEMSERVREANTWRDRLGGAGEGPGRPLQGGGGPVSWGAAALAPHRAAP